MAYLDKILLQFASTYQRGSEQYVSNGELHIETWEIHSSHVWSAPPFWCRLLVLAFSGFSARSGCVYFVSEERCPFLTPQWAPTHRNSPHCLVLRSMSSVIV